MKFDNNKILSLILIIVLSVNSFGTAITFTIFQKKIRKEIKSKIKAGLAESQLDIFEVDTRDASFRRVNSHEFRFKGKLYDIIVENQISDFKILFKAINDTKEEKLFENLSKLVTNTLNSDSPTAQTMKKILNLLNFDTFLSKLEQSNLIPRVIELKRIIRIYSIIEIFGETPYPPPKLSF